MIKYILNLIILLSFCQCSTLNNGQEEIKNKKMTSLEKAYLFIEMANGALVEGDPTGALQSLALAEIENPNIAELYHSKALAYFQKHEIHSAIQAAKKALELKPSYSEANNTLGKLLMDYNQNEQANVYLKKAAQDPFFREAYKAWTNLGILHYRQGKFLQAESYLSKAISSSPQQSCVAHYYLGHIKLKDSQLNEAVQQYNQATQRLCANFGDAQLALGVAYQRSQQFDHARKTYLEIQKRYPNTELAQKAFDYLKYLP